jgi:hypothetical protein
MANYHYKYLAECLRYDAETGELFWKQRGPTRRFSTFEKAKEAARAL